MGDRIGVSTEGLWVAMIQKARSSVVLGQAEQEQ